MPAKKLVQVVTLIKHRRAKAVARQRAFSQRALRAGAWLLGAISVAAAVLALAALPAFFYFTQGLPTVEHLEALLDTHTGELLKPTTFVDRTGQHVLLTLEPPSGQRAFVSAIDNYYLATAFIASRDPDFLSSPGRGLLELDGGPQGIAENMVASLLLPGEPEGWLKTLRARILATDVIARYGHQQVLNWAMNCANFGHLTFGVESAAQLYFGKPAAQLSLAEAALLAAVAQAPALNPIDAPALALEYQRLVLAAMRDQALISEEEFAAAFAELIVFSIGIADPGSQAPEFTRLALEQLLAALGAERVQLGGLTVVTTLDYELQQTTASLLTGAEGEVAVLDPNNGQILALAGGAASNVHPASALRLPFLYLNVFALGQGPATLVWDLPDSTHFAAVDYLGPLTMRQALSAGLLTPVQEWVAQIDEERLVELFRALGLNGDATEASVLQLATAFGVLANNGSLAGQFSNGLTTSSTVLFVGNAQDVAVLNWTIPTSQSITNPELAILVNDVLADASLRFSSPTIAASRPMAIFESHEAGEWRVGYSPQRSVVLWTELEASKTAVLMTELLEAAHLGLPVRNWALPAGLSTIVVCVPSGMLPDEDCPLTRRELFVSGTEPTEADSLYERIALNSVSGKLATVFTPEEFVEERIFVIIPPEAETWARRAGFEVPPEDYDPISLLELQSGPLLIARPAAFSEVSGVVGLVGILAEGTVAFDFQVGRGLRPTEWMLLVEEENDAEVSVAAEWDTRGLSGVWAIQLQAWDEAGVLRRTYVIVSIVE
ncbi:MAG: transglycosylase domain-containing protein [Anaerolineales bacterium]